MSSQIKSTCKQNTSNKNSSDECKDHQHPTSKVLDSEEDSEDGSRQEDFMAWSEMSIFERLGHNSFDMTEEELENAFSQLALAFHCDQHTLDQRLQAEEHARNYAEENLKLEVERGQDLLETLKGMCLDIKRAKVIQSLELCLNIISGTIERISNTAEVLGAVHQEAKVSCAVELMVAHVENLRRRHERDSVELEGMKKQMQKGSRGPQAFEIWEEKETFQKIEKKTHQLPMKRRISAAIISKQDQKTHRDTAFIPLSSEEVSGSNNSAQVQTPDFGGSTENKPDQKNDQVLDRRPHSMLPHHKLKSKAALETGSPLAKGPQHNLSVCNTLTIGLQRPLILWMLHCRWIIITVYLFVLCSIIMLAIVVWFLQAPVLWL